MKVKGLPSKIFKLSPNGGFCSGSELGRLKEGGAVDLKRTSRTAFKYGYGRIN